MNIRVNEYIVANAIDYDTRTGSSAQTPATTSARLANRSDRVTASSPQARERRWRKRSKDEHASTASSPGAPSTMRNSRSPQAALNEIVERCPPSLVALAAHALDGEQDLLAAPTR
jgi:hypothetical protein